MIRCYKEDTDFVFRNRLFNRRWLDAVARNEGKSIGNINIIFCSDSYLLDINIKYLGHDYYTDIITFDYCEGDVLSGDLFISVDSVRDNAAFYETGFSTELNRVIVHGVLHLAGYDDHSDSEQKTMRSKEDYYLGLREKI